jgi:LysR family cys regulon transcriptional activator
MAFEPSHYQNLTAIPVDHFGRFTSWMAVRDDAEIRQYGRAFMELCQKQFSQ